MTSWKPKKNPNGIPSTGNGVGIRFYNLWKSRPPEMTCTKVEAWNWFIKGYNANQSKLDALHIEIKKLQLPEVQCE